MNHRTDTFLQYYSILENKVQEITRSRETESLRSMLRKACEANKYLKYKRELLEDICNLRNVLVHEYGNVIISVPTDECIEEMRNLIQRIDDMPSMYKLFKHEKVLSVDKNDSLLKSMQVMKKHDYSQLPVIYKSGFQGLLSRNVISRWIECNLENDLSLNQLLSNTQVIQVLDLEDTMDKVAFIDRNMDLYEFVEYSSKSISPSGVYIITEHGKAHEKPLAIITPFDNDVILKELDL